MKKVLIAILMLFFVSSSSYGAEDVFHISTVKGKKLTLHGTKNGVLVDEYKGKILFVEFWGTWCGPCLLSIPHHAKMQEKYKDDLRIIAFETTPDLSKEALANFVKDPKNIDMSKVQWYLDNKARSPEAKKYLEKPVNELKNFRKAGKPINYDVVASKDGNKFISYIAYRANWQGGIPYLLVFDKKGNLITIEQGMPSESRLDNIIKAILNAQNNTKKDNNTTVDKNSTKEANSTK